ncbi:MAG: response regulator [Deltaproteobacteria bacterium]|nr:response regulator [Deltaproteobacteria bacterium]
MITSNTKNILLADDSVFFRVKLSDILSEAGHRAHFASDGEEVINYIKRSRDKIDLLILDLQMPRADGFDVLEWLKQDGNKDDMPVLVITGAYEPEEVALKLKKYGVSGLMTKGFSAEQALYNINKILFADEAVSLDDRAPISIPVDFDMNGLLHTGFTLNISHTGLFLHTIKEIKAGSKLKIRFSLPEIDRVFSLKGTVIWTTPQGKSGGYFEGAGITFTSTTKEEEGLLKDYVKSSLESLKNNSF